MEMRALAYSIVFLHISLSYSGEVESGECINTNTGSVVEDASLLTEDVHNSDNVGARILDDQEDDDMHELVSLVRAGEFYIDGTWTKMSSLGNNTFDVVDPSTARPVARIASADQTDVDAAVSAAERAFKSWHLDTTASERRKYVENLLELYLEYQEEMAQLVSLEMGCPIEASRTSQVGAGEYHIEEYLYAFDDFEFVRNLPSAGEASSTTILMEPAGVVALITPWNWPLNQITLKVVPALLVGCTCVLKPSEESPLSALLFAYLVHEAGFPPGVFNLVNGDGSVGAMLSSHRKVDMVSFTGSSRAGASVASNAAATFKRVTLELGGKGANIVFADVGEEWFHDIVVAGAESVFYNSGQSCNAPTRMLVQQPFYETAIQIAKEVAEGTLVDSAHVEGAEHMGPVVSRQQFQKIQRYIQLGVEEGARLVAGGLGRPEHLKDSPGYYVRPTVFANCKPHMTIMREEIFGPVFCITPFDSEEEAVDLANDSLYGLTNYAYTLSRARRRRLALALRSGMVEMNDAAQDYGAPFGGMKGSGYGREGGIYGLEEFCHVKAVTGWDYVEGDDEEPEVAEEE